MATSIRRPRSKSIACAAALLLLLPMAAGAQQNQPDRERGSFMIGAFITDRASSTRVDSDRGPGTDLDFEDDLGLESSTNVVRLGGYFWINPRHRIDVSYFDLSREASRQISETIDFGDLTFAIDTAVTTNNDLSITKVDYTFAALSRERGYLGIVGGLYVASFQMSLSEPRLGRAETEGLTAPLPVFGLRGEYQVGKHFTLRASSQWFGIDTGDVDGTLRDNYFGADYRFGQRMAVGLGYNNVSMDLDVQKRFGFKGAVDWGYDGILLFLKLDFGR